MTYIEITKMSYDFWDTIDFIPFIKKYKEENQNNLINVRDLMDIIEDYYDNNEEHVKLLPEDFQGCFFNFADRYEFGRYLHNRYGYQITTEVIENTYIIV